MPAPASTPRLLPIAPAATQRQCRKAPLPDVLCFDPAYESAEIILSCADCYDGLDVVVPAGVFTSRSSQAGADAMAREWAEGQLRCSPLDPGQYLPEWGGLTGDTALSPVDTYGALGFSRAAFSEAGDQRAWCSYSPAYAYCDGPEQEFATPGTVLDRYSTRWGGKLEGGFITYGVVGESWVRVSDDLFPAQLINAAPVLGFCFDANARPCFAVQFGGAIELHRFVAGVPTTYSWQGSSPVLFFNGVVQYDDALRDVVAYYLRDGRLYARFQRDNFSAERPVYVSGGVDDLSRIVVTERGRGATASYHFLTAETVDGALIALRAGPYHPWPLFAKDEAAVAVGPVTGAYQRVVVEAGSYSDAAAITLGPVTGIYRSTAVQLPPAADEAAVSLAPVTGIHRLVLVQAGSYSDAAVVTLGPVTGVHKFTLIQAGSYSDAASVTVGPVTGVHAHA